MSNFDDNTRRTGHVCETGVVEKSSDIRTANYHNQIFRGTDAEEKNLVEKNRKSQVEKSKRAVKSRLVGESAGGWQ